MHITDISRPMMACLLTLDLSRRVVEDIVSLSEAINVITCAQIFRWFLYTRLPVNDRLSGVFSANRRGGGQGVAVEAYSAREGIKVEAQNINTIY
jgi:hypothetical protein